MSQDPRSAGGQSYSGGDIEEYKENGNHTPGLEGSMEPASAAQRVGSTDSGECVQPEYSASPAPPLASLCQWESSRHTLKLSTQQNPCRKMVEQGWVCESVPFI